MWLRPQSSLWIWFWWKKQSNNVYFATCHLSACWKDQIWWSRPDCWPSLSRGVASKRSIFPHQTAVKWKGVHLWNLWMEFYTISPFKFVEICVVHNPQTPDTLKVEIQETIKKPNHPLCGVNLTINKKDAIFQNYLPCNKTDYFITNSKQTVDLLCPNLFKFHSVQSRNVSWKKGTTQQMESTKCIICKSDNLFHAKENYISICSFDDYIWRQQTTQ